MLKINIDKLSINELELIRIKLFPGFKDMSTFEFGMAVLDEYFLDVGWCKTSNSFFARSNGTISRGNSPHEAIIKEAILLRGRELNRIHYVPIANSNQVERLLDLSGIFDIQNHKYVIERFPGSEKIGSSTVTRWETYFSQQAIKSK